MWVGAVQDCQNEFCFTCSGYTSCDRGGSRGAIAPIVPPKTYETNFIHDDFLQFGKQHSRHKAFSSSPVLSQKCCEVYFTTLAIAKPSCDITTKITEIAPSALSCFHRWRRKRLKMKYCDSKQAATRSFGGNSPNEVRTQLAQRVPTDLLWYTYPVAYLGQGRHGTYHGRHFDVGSKIVWQKLKFVTCSFFNSSAPHTRCNH